MMSAAVHAQQAGAKLGQALKEGPATTFQVSHAKVGLNQSQVVVHVSPEVAKRFGDQTVLTRLNLTLVPGKPVLEIWASTAGRTKFSPHRSGSFYMQVLHNRVDGASGFPPFGTCKPDSVVLGRDNVLRITLPAKRPPVMKFNRTKIVKSKTKSAPAQKEPEVQNKEEKIASLPVARLPAAPETETMRYKDTMVAYSTNSLRVLVGRQLAQHMDSHRYLLKSVEATDDGALVVLSDSPTGGSRVGTTFVGELRVLTFSHPPKVQDLEWFGPTVAATVESVREGREIHIRVSRPFTAPRQRANRDTQKQYASGEPSLPQAVEDHGLTRLRRLRDEINATVRELTDAGDEVKLRVKENGVLGFTYEG
jgi:hypothetical protein